MAHKYKFRVLSIDGGGIRGIIPALILDAIEKETGKQIYEMFDLIAGTSTGGMLALGLTKPDPNHPNKALYKAEELVSLYEGEAGKLIFQHPHQSIFVEAIDEALKQLSKISNLLFKGDVENLFRAKYSADGREKVLGDKLGNTFIEQAVKEVFITSYDTELRIPIFFTSDLKRENKTAKSFHKVCKGITMKDAAMATSAAPTYFPPHKIDKQDKESTKGSGYYSLVDGGVFANNPTALAIMEAIITYNSNHKQSGEKLHLDDILVVSLGTGSLTRSYKYDEIKHWGILKFAAPTLDIVFDGESESVSCQLEQLLPEANDIPKQYYRFQVDLTEGSDDMDDASSENIKKLRKHASDLISEKKKKRPTSIRGWDSDWLEMCAQLSESVNS
jgi:patatin-like phospholipase/acyl hydrolase